MRGILQGDPNTFHRRRRHKFDVEIFYYILIINFDALIIIYS